VRYLEKLVEEIRSDRLWVWVLRLHPDCKLNPGNACHDNVGYVQIRRFRPGCVNASSAQVKNFAEKPFICNMAARVDAMTGSSSTTKIRGTGPGDT
jgi:hypothetical protein